MPVDFLSCSLSILTETSYLNVTCDCLKKRKSRLNVMQNREQESYQVNDGKLILELGMGQLYSPPYIKIKIHLIDLLVHSCLDFMSFLNP